MSSRGQKSGVLLIACALAAATPITTRAAVDVELRPIAVEAVVGDIIEIGLYAATDDGSSHPIGALSAIFLWDSTRLEIHGYINNGPYPWLNSWFPDDSGLDGLNAPFGAGAGWVPDNDGDAFYEAWSQWADPPGSAIATADGLLVTTVQFRAIGAGSATIALSLTAGLFTRTRVMDGNVPGLEITGDLGPPVKVDIQACALPVVFAEGARYIAVTPAASDQAIAILISGAADDPDVACVSLYAQPDGRLGPEAVFQTPDQWNTVHIADTQVVPATDYEIQVDCGADPGSGLTDAVVVTTWTWGDVNNDGIANGDDLLVVLDATQGIFPPGVTVPNVDLAGCQPNGTIDGDDIIAVGDAVQGIGYLCPEVCTTNVNLEDFAAFRTCMAGPAVDIAAGCEPFDFNDSGRVDAGDFAWLQNVFATP